MLEDVFDEGFALEDGEGFGFLSGSEEAWGDGEGVLDGDGDAAFAGAVEFGDDQAVEWAGFVEFLGLLEGVVAGGGVDDEEGEVGGGFVVFGDGTADFSEFLHEVVPGVDAAGGVADEELGPVCDGFLVSGEADGGGVGVGVAFDDGEAEAISPALELFDGGGAEGVCCGEDDGVAAAFEPVAEFGGGSGFSGAVDADDEDDEGLAVRAGGGGRGVGGESVCEVSAGGFDDVVTGDFAAEVAEFVDDFGGEAES